MASKTTSPQVTNLGPYADSDFQERTPGEMGLGDTKAPDWDIPASKPPADAQGDPWTRNSRTEK